MSLPDELWMMIMREWVQDAVDWAGFSQTCRHFYRLPRPRPIQVVNRELRYPHVLFIEEILSHASDGSEEDLRLLCFNDGDEESSNDSSLTGLLLPKHFRIYTYLDGDKAYLEPFYYNSSFSCEKQPSEERTTEGYGLVFHYEATAVKQSYGSSYHPNRGCFWLMQQRPDSPEWVELRYGNQESSMPVDFDSFFKAFLLIEDPIWVDYRLEDYRADLPFFLSCTPAFWHDQWRQRLYQALPCQPLPFVSHSYQTNLFAPESWEDVDYAQDDITDFIHTGQRTAKVIFSMKLCDSHIIIKSPPQSFGLRLPLLQQDLELFKSSDPAAWLHHLFERRSRRWYVARKYWRLAADVQESRLEVSVESAVRDWPLMHPDYVYSVSDDGDFLLELPTVQVATDPDTGEFIQQTGNEGLCFDRFWCAVLHG